MDIVLDGNPSLPENGGAEGLARRHCCASLMNHTEIQSHRNAMFIDLPNHIDADTIFVGHKADEGIIGIVLLVATRDIESYEQVLGNYQSGADVIIDDNDRLCF
jgi:hypothetical protein